MWLYYRSPTPFVNVTLGGSPLCGQPVWLPGDDWHRNILVWICRSSVTNPSEYERNHHWTLNGHLLLNRYGLNFRSLFTYKYPQLISSRDTMNNCQQTFNPIVNNIWVFFYKIPQRLFIEIKFQKFIRGLSDK